MPRAGRLDVRVTGVVDSRAYPWNRSPIPVDPVVELYSTSGTLLRHTDAVSESGTELAQTTVSGPARILVKVWNWYANGNPARYTVVPTYVDTARPKATVSYPSSGASGVSRIARPRVTFDEPVANVTSATVRLRDVAANTIVPGTVTYDSASRTATITTGRLGRERQYRVEATTGVTDIAGNALAATVSLTFTTGPGTFPDADGNVHEASIEWIYANGITSRLRRRSASARTAW